ncbi:MAG: phosphotransferase [Clostridia bacterium]|nr:phosphotransferase [Clostridia bacterium]
MYYNLDNPIAERKTKTVYKDNDKTIKLFIPNYPKSNILNEAVNQARVEETGLNIPSLVEVTKIEDRWALVSEHIEGRTLESLMEEHPEKLDEYLNLFVDTQINILSKEAPLLNKLKDKMQRKIAEADISQDIKYELNIKLESMLKHKKICHGDFNPSNVIIKENGEVYVIDWAHVTQGNASADVARTYLLFCLNGKKEEAEKYLNIYSEKTGTEKRYIQKWIPIVAAAHLPKASEEEKAFLMNWVDVIEYQ